MSLADTILAEGEDRGAFPDSLDPFEGGQRPGPPFDRTQLPPLNRTHKRRRAFKGRYFGIPGLAEETREVTAAQARAIVDCRLRVFKMLNSQFAIYERKTCYFDPLPVDPRTSYPPGEFPILEQEQ